MKYLLSLLVGILVVNVLGTGGRVVGEEKGADIYKSRELRLLPVLKIDGDSIPEPHYFLSPTALVEDEHGFIFVSDFRAHNIKKFDPEGNFLQVIGRHGAGPGDFNIPSRLAYSGGNIIVIDEMNFRFCILTTGGTFIKSVKFSRDQRPRKIKSLDNNELLVEFEKVRLDSPKPQERIIQIFSNMLEWGKTIYKRPVLRSIFVKEPIFAEIIQPFPPSVLWDVSTDGKVIIGFSESDTIEIYDKLKGKISSFSHPFEPVRVTGQDKKRFFAGLVYYIDGKRVKKYPDYIIKNTHFPRFKPLFASITVDSGGNILVMDQQKGDDKNWFYFNVFNPAGKFINKVKISGDINVQTFISGNNYCFWDIKIDEEGEFVVTKYKLACTIDQ